MSAEPLLTRTWLADALVVALGAEGAQVRDDRRRPGFTRLAMTVADGRSVIVEVAHDARIREAVQLSFGRVLYPDETVADKTLALFGRAAARDLVDVAALSERYTLERLCELAVAPLSGQLWRLTVRLWAPNVRRSAPSQPRRREGRLARRSA